MENTFTGFQHDWRTLQQMLAADDTRVFLHVFFEAQLLLLFVLLHQNFHHLQIIFLNLL